MKWKIAGGIAAVAICLAVCIFFRISSWNDIKAYAGMQADCPDVWKDLALRKIHAGQSLQDIEKINKPVLISKYGRYSYLEFTPPAAGLSFMRIGIILKDGRACSAKAGSCTWDHTFFDTLSDSGRMELEKEIHLYVKSLTEHVGQHNGS